MLGHSGLQTAPCFVKAPLACMIKWAVCHRKFDAYRMTNVCFGCWELNSIVDLQKHQNTIKGWHQTCEPREFLGQKELNLKVQEKSTLVCTLVHQFGFADSLARRSGGSNNPEKCVCLPFQLFFTLECSGVVKEQSNTKQCLLSGFNFFHYSIQ